MAHIRCVFKMQDSENEAIILLQLEDYKYCQTPSDKVLLWALFHCLTCFGIVFLLRQLWIVNYYVKSSSNNPSNENITLCVSREMILQK